MATVEQMNQDEAEFGAAFAEEDQAAVEQTEDEAFGIEPEEDGGTTATGAVDVAMVVDAEAVEDAAGEAMASETSEAAAEPMPEPMAEGEGDAAQVNEPGADIEKERQRLRSWEGRLKAMEAELRKAGANTDAKQTAVVADAIETASDSTDSPAEDEQVEQIAEQVEAGEMSVSDALKQLSEDFGEDFVRMIEAIATSKAREAGGAAAAEKMGEMAVTVDSIIADIVDTKSKAHFSAIADAHPDFNEVGGSEEFKDFISSMPEADQDEAMRVVTAGSAKEIVDLLSQFKSAMPQAEAGGEMALTEAQDAVIDEVDTDAMDAAEGVRSSGMKLPEQPGSKAGYEDAWNDFS